MEPTPQGRGDPRQAERERGEHPEPEQAVYVEAPPGERRVEHEREQQEKSQPFGDAA